MALFGEKGLVRSAESGGKIREVDVRAGDCTSVAEDSGACSLQECKHVLCFGDIFAGAGDD